jgi:two-component system, NtrC family, sensor histidine kinase HydH
MPTPPQGFEEIQRQEVNRLFGHIVGVRLLFVPVVMAFATWIAFTDPAPWRRILVSVTATVAVGFFTVEAARARRRGVETLSLPLNLVAAALGISLICLGTGGLDSPFLFLLPVVSLVFGVLLEAPALLLAVGIPLVAVVLFAAARLGAPDLLGLAVLGGGRPRAGALLEAGVLAFLVVGGAGLGVAIRSVFDGMVRRALLAREESLRAWRDREAELSALAGEIAHELKNPLASVKGLATLLAPALPDGRSAERLAVLRREVDRMQSILDEFLNFSRPLVPLALGSADLGALARDVAALHEGMAQERGVGLAVSGAATARCDPRKVKQVLVNLVQNALDASSPGEAVEIDVAEEGGEARLAVRDRGPGLDRAVAARVFEPGVTTKPGGSGIGLTVARALARQHGGELRLAPRGGGGLEAVLSLPRQGPAAEAA